MYPREECNYNCDSETAPQGTKRSRGYFFIAKQFVLAKRLAVSNRLPPQAVSHRSLSLPLATMLPQVVWFIGNSIVFLNSYSEYKNNSKYYYVYSMLGVSTLRLPLPSFCLSLSVSLFEETDNEKS